MVKLWKLYTIIVQPNYDVSTYTTDYKLSF